MQNSSYTGITSRYRNLRSLRKLLLELHSCCFVWPSAPEEERFIFLSIYFLSRSSENLQLCTGLTLGACKAVWLKRLKLFLFVLNIVKWLWMVSQQFNWLTWNKCLPLKNVLMIKILCQRNKIQAISQFVWSICMEDQWMHAMCMHMHSHI